MKACSFFVFMLALVLQNETASGQSQKAKVPFPTYDQIRQKDQDTYDYVNRDGTARVIQKDSINLFNYPSGTVTYILNGKSSDDVNYVRRVLSEKGKHIESISISQASETARRIIAIKFGVR